MAISSLYSRRKRQLENAGKAEVYQYDDVPHSLRVQIIHIWRGTIGQCSRSNRHSYGFGQRPPNSDDWWNEIHSVLAREKGLFELASADNDLDRCAHYLLSATNVEDILDTIEVTFRRIQNLAKLDKGQWQLEAVRRDLEQRPNDALAELNFRLREAEVGYQFENGEIIRIDSQFVHAEAVKPALSLLSDARFLGPHEEFLHAHESYRTAKPDDHKKREDAIAGALKAFESTLEVICDLKKWPHPANATAIPLIKIVIDNGLIPPFLQSSMEGLATLTGC
ncbi:MAG: STM4504/CBY_0614 family protein [Candidatus Binataceae bacterium]